MKSIFLRYVHDIHARLFLGKKRIPLGGGNKFSPHRTSKHVTWSSDFSEWKTSLEKNSSFIKTWHKYIAAGTSNARNIVIKQDAQGFRRTLGCAVCCVLCAVCCVLCAVCCVLCAVCCVVVTRQPRLITQIPPPPMRSSDTKGGSEKIFIFSLENVPTALPSPPPPPGPRKKNLHI